MNFRGVQITEGITLECNFAPIIDFQGGLTHLKEIPNTKLLVSLHRHWQNSANMEIFDIAKKRKVNKIYSFEEIYGSSIASFFLIFCSSVSAL